MVRFLTSRAQAARMLGGILAYVVSIGPLYAQAPSDTLPTTRSSLASSYVDPLLRQGTLSNGLRYYVRKNAMPAGRAELRLIVDAGSINEDEDQRGLAHFVEHIAFNGTKRFPKHQLIRYLESVGMTFGGDINASTSYDETIYILSIPTERQILDTALLILEDWAHAVSFDSAEIDAERGVVMEERRLRSGPAMDQYQRHAPYLLGSLYASRQPIGLGHIITSAPREALVRFYQDWYRPDLMTIVAVGDFDPAWVEAEIQARFGQLPKAMHPRARPVTTVPNRNGPLVSIATDERISQYSAILAVPIEAQDARWSPLAVRRRASAWILDQVLNERFRVLARSQGSPIRRAAASQRFVSRNRLMHTIDLLAEESTTLELGILAVRAEVARMARDGVLDSEFEFARQQAIEWATRVVARDDFVLSSELVGEYIDQILRTGPRPSKRVTAELLLEYFPKLTSREIQTLAREWHSHPGWIVMVDAPSSGAHGTITGATILEVLQSGEEQKLPPYRDTAVARVLANESLVATPPHRGQIVERKTHSVLGITEWILSNGARVLLKPTPWTKDNISIQAISLGGVSLASDTEYLNARVATQLIGSSGLGNDDNAILARRLDGKIGQLHAAIDEYKHSIVVAGSPRHAVTIFEALYLAFTHPRIDSSVFANWRRAARRNAPRGAQVEFDRALSQRHPRRRPVFGAAADSVDPAEVLNFYKKRFGDAAQMTFVIVGDIDQPLLEPLVEQYIGGLPGKGSHELGVARDEGIRPPPGAVRRTVIGEDTISRTTIVFTAESAITNSSNAMMGAVESVLRRRLINRLREELAGTYSVNVKGNASSLPYPHESLHIQFSSKPERVTELQNALFAVIDTLIRDGVTADEFAFTRLMLARKYEINLLTSWPAIISRSLLLGQSLDELATEVDNPAPASIESVNIAIRRLLTLDRYVLVQELPVRLAPPQRDELLPQSW